MDTPHGCLTKHIQKKLDRKYSLKQNLEATFHKTAVVWPLASHLTNHSSKMNKTCETQLEKQGLTL